MTPLEWEWEDLRRTYERSKNRIPDAELLEIFPTARELVSEKAKRLSATREEITGEIRQRIRFVQANIPEADQWFSREIIAASLGERVVKIDQEIKRLHRILWRPHSSSPKPNTLSPEIIERAKAVPIEEIISPHLTLKKSGVNLAGLCPFHQEKTPSFYVYRKDNRFYCFGCGKHGDSISFLREVGGYSFTEAVRQIIPFNFN